MAQCNVKNRTIFCKDNLDVLEGINSASIDLIYLDPPFNSNKTYTALIGSSAEGASFKDYFHDEDLKDEWLFNIKEDHEKIYAFLETVRVLEDFKIESKKKLINNKDKREKTSSYCYLSYMAIRLIEIQRILKETGSIYLHCDTTMSHYLKILLDIIFEAKNFRNEIVWCYGSGGTSNKYFSKKHDCIYFYSKTNNYNFSKLEHKSYLDKSKGYNNKVVWLKDEQGEYRISGMRDVWDMPIINNNAKERTGYRTQKPIPLLERIIRASTNKNDIVLDPFCGCATTCVASEKLGRKWIGIDVSVKAYELVKERLKKEVKGLENDGQQDLLNYDKEINYIQTPPSRTDDNREDLRLKKYVYVISNKSLFPNHYKVGIAIDYKKRLNSYQTSDPSRGYKLEYKKHTYLFRETEKHIHNHFESLHEWVRASKEDIIKEMEKYLDK